MNNRETLHFVNPEPLASIPSVFAFAPSCSSCRIESTAFGVILSLRRCGMPTWFQERSQAPKPKPKESQANMKAACSLNTWYEL